jgi:hypothetical protein
MAGRSSTVILDVVASADEISLAIGAEVGGIGRANGADDAEFARQVPEVGSISTDRSTATNAAGNCTLSYGLEIRVSAGTLERISVEPRLNRASQFHSHVDSEAIKR